MTKKSVIVVSFLRSSIFTSSAFFVKVSPAKVKASFCDSDTVFFFAILSSPFEFHSQNGFLDFIF